jgi:hypothetical protein
MPSHAGVDGPMMGIASARRPHTATGEQSQVLVAAVNRHMHTWGNQPRIRDANEVTILMRQLTRSAKTWPKRSSVHWGMIASRSAQASPATAGRLRCRDRHRGEVRILDPPSVARGRCGGHVAVHGSDKYLTLLACGGVALGSQ